MTLVVFIDTNAQYKQANYFEANVAFAKNRYDFNLNWHHLHPISKNKKLKFGYGIRSTNFVAVQPVYTSAPAQIVKGTNGPAVLFTKKIEENIDSLYLVSSASSSLNAFMIFQYTFFNKLDLGFTLDLIGFTLGSTGKSYLINEKRIESFNLGTIYKTSNFNLLLIDVNDRGSLNSELFVRYWFSKKWAAKLAVSHLFTEITTDEKVQKIPQENDRFRLVSNLVSVGVTFKPWE